MASRDNGTRAKEFNEAYNLAMSVWSPWFQEAKKDLRFRLGDPWSWNDKVYLKMQQRDALVFNKIRRVVKLLTGYQRQNRLAMKVDPIEGSDDKTASQFSGLLQTAMTEQHGYVKISDAFEHGPVTTGLNLLELSLDFGLDPVNGDLRFTRVPYNTSLLDPYFTERDLSNCNYILRRKWLGKEELKAALPDISPQEFDRLVPRGRDGKFPDSPPATNYLGDSLFRFDEFYRRNTRPAKLLVDRMTGNFIVWGGDQRRLDAFLRSPDAETGLNVGDRVAVEPHYIKTVELVILVEDENFYDGPDLLGIDDYPHAALLGEWVPEYAEMKDKLQGVVRCMRDPQTEANRRRLKILDIMDSVISSGFKAEEGAVVSPKSLFQTGQNRVVFVKDGKMAGLEQLTGGNVPQGLFQMQELMDQDIMQLPGVEGLLTAPEQQNQEIAFALAKLREGQGLTPQQDLFDNLRAAKASLGQKMIFTIQKNWTPAKVKRLLNQEPTKEFYNRDFGRYDCVPTEGMLTDSQRQRYFAQLMMMKKMGAPVSWATLIKASPLETKEELLAEIQKAEQSQMMLTKEQMITKQVTDKLLQAEAASRIAGAQEKMTKMQADRARAGLDVAKTMAEIQKMDADRLMSLLQIALDIERQGGMGFETPTPAGKVIPMRREAMMTRR